MLSWPEHFDLLMSEPEIDTAENSILTLRKRYGRRYNASARSDEQVWETRYADVHVFDLERIRERLAFMHQQPVKAGLVAEATEWEWSSARAWAGLPEGVVTVDRTIDPKALVTYARKRPRRIDQARFFQKFRFSVACQASSPFKSLAGCGKTHVLYQGTTGRSGLSALTAVSG